jgi:hypothetical protein
VVTDANGCQGNTFFIIDITSIAPSRATGSVQLTAGNRFGLATSSGSLYLYPNPSNGLVHVQINSQEKGNAVFNLVDMSGRVVKTMTVYLEKGANTKDLLLPVSAGIYMLQIRTSKESRTLSVRLY